MWRERRAGFARHRRLIEAAKRDQLEEIERLRREIELGDRGAKRELKKLLKRRTPLKWYEQARIELEIDEEVVIRDMKKNRDWNVSFYEMIGDGREEYWVFEDFDDASALAVEVLIDSMETDPEAYGNVLEEHAFVPDQIAEMIASEEADAYVDDLDADEIVDRARLDLDEFDDEIDRLEEEIWEAEEEGDPDGVADDLREDLINVRSDRDEAIEDGREELREEYRDDILDRLQNDLHGYLEDMGMTVADADWVNVDYKAAAESIVNLDGPEWELARHDGNSIDLSNGAVAYRQN